jgi:hypothetical protein
MLVLPGPSENILPEILRIVISSVPFRSKSITTGAIAKTTIGSAGRVTSTAAGAESMLKNTLAIPKQHDTTTDLI